MLIYVNITDRRTDRQTDRQTHQKYSSEPHKKKNKKGRDLRRRGLQRHAIAQIQLADWQIG